MPGIKTYFSSHRQFLTLLYLLPFLLFPGRSSAQEDDLSETFRSAQRCVCAIRVMEGTGDDAESYSLGCGVVLSSKLKEKYEYFIATAYHVVEPVIEEDDMSMNINLFDQSGIMYSKSDVRRKHIAWFDKSVDAALIILPHGAVPAEELPDNYSFPGFQFLKQIGEPDWGEDIYLMGYRWMNEDLFIDILKKGIVSVGTKELPGYRGQLIYLIDNMANKGMSGGLAFRKDGTGIGIISSYVYEEGDRIQKSDDLTVCVPLMLYFNVLSTTVVNYRDEILKLLDE